MVSKVAPHFDEIIALVASGMSIPKVLKTNPSFPCVHTWKCYVYDERFPGRRKALEEAQSVTSHFGRSARHFDEILKLVEVGMTIGEALASDPKFPLRSIFRRYVKARPDLDRRLNEAKPNRSKIAFHFDEVRKRVDRGESVSSALAALPIKASLTCLKGFAEKSVDRQKWIEGLKAARARRSSDIRTPALVRNDKREHQFTRALYSNDLYRTVAAAVPKFIEGTIRDDVITDVIVAILSGKLDEGEIGKKVKKLSAKYFQEDRFKHRSIYAPFLPGAEDSIVDHVCDDLQNWGL